MARETPFTELLRGTAQTVASVFLALAWCAIAYFDAGLVELGPYLLIIPAVLAIVLGRFLFLRRRARRLRLLGHFCLHCGYDLRASLERCPECGTVVEQPAAIELPKRMGPWRAQIYRFIERFAWIAALITGVLSLIWIPPGAGFSNHPLPKDWLSRSSPRISPIYGIGFDDDLNFGIEFWLARDLDDWPTFLRADRLGSSMELSAGVSIGRRCFFIPDHLTHPVRDCLWFKLDYSVLFTATIVYLAVAIQLRSRRRFRETDAPIKFIAVVPEPPRPRQ